MDALFKRKATTPTTTSPTTSAPVTKGSKNDSDSENEISPSEMRKFMCDVTASMKNLAKENICLRQQNDLLLAEIADLKEVKTSMSDVTNRLKIVEDAQKLKRPQFVGRPPPIPGLVFDNLVNEHHKVVEEHDQRHQKRNNLVLVGWLESSVPSSTTEKSDKSLWADENKNPELRLVREYFLKKQDDFYQAKKGVSQGDRLSADVILGVFRMGRVAVDARCRPLKVLISCKLAHDILLKSKMSMLNSTKYTYLRQDMTLYQRKLQQEAKCILDVLRGDTRLKGRQFVLRDTSSGPSIFERHSVKHGAQTITEYDCWGSPFDPLLLGDLRYWSAAGFTGRTSPWGPSGSSPTPDETMANT